MLDETSNLTATTTIRKVLGAVLLCTAIFVGHLAGSPQSPALNGDGTPSFTFPPGTHSTRIPFELLANAIYVSAKVNGRGPFLFAIDTGSCCSVFASELAAEMGMNPQGEARGMGAGSSSNAMGLVRGKIEFTFPEGLKLSTEDANTVSMAALWPLIGRRFYGNIGYDVLKDLVVRFDYDKKIATFYSPATFKHSGNGQTLPAMLQMNYDPQIPGAFTVSGLAPVSTLFTIDTGAGGTIITTPLVRKNHLLENVSRKLPSPSHGVGSGVSNDVVGRIDSIRLGNYLLQQPLVALSQDTEGTRTMEDWGVNLGGNILRRFILTIDYPRRTLTLEPNSHYADPFPADASGLVLKAEGSNFRTFIVQGIVPGSPAADAKLQEGDQIVAVDGGPSDKYALWEIQDLLKNSGHIIRLAVDRGGKSFICELQLKSLL